MGFGRNDRGRGGFGGRGGGRSFGGGFGGRDRGRREMFDVTCTQCGKECQVPFKPTNGKPVLCSECFGKDGGSRGANGGNSAQMDAINRKLDKIIAILSDLELDTDEELSEQEIEGDEGEHMHAHTHENNAQDEEDMEDEEDFEEDSHVSPTVAEDEEESY